MEDDHPLIKLFKAVRVFYHWKLRKHVRLPYRPMEVSLELTNRCNFKCAYCLQSDPEHSTKVPATAITPESASALFEKLRTGGLKTSIMHWGLDGEPFMNKEFDKVVGVAASHGFSVHQFATNGYFVTPERLRSFPREGCRYFLTPDFCSEEAYFEEYRGTPGSWKVVRDKLRAVLEAPELSHFHIDMNDISAFRIHDPMELKHRFEELKALFPESDRISFYPRVFHNATGFLPIGEEEIRSRGKYHLCPYPWFSFIIASNGDVVACCRDLQHKTVLGNLLKEDFEAIWNGEKYQALRRDLADENPQKQAACKGCDMPYAAEKFSVRNLVTSAVHRVLVLESGSNPDS